MKIDGKMHYLWRAVDHEGEVLEPFATNERDKKAALKFMKTYGEQRLVAVGLTAPYGTIGVRQVFGGDMSAVVKHACRDAVRRR